MIPALLAYSLAERTRKFAEREQWNVWRCPKCRREVRTQQRFTINPVCRVCGSQMKIVIPEVGEVWRLLR